MTDDLEKLKSERDRNWNPSNTNEYDRLNDKVKEEKKRLEIKKEEKNRNDPPWKASSSIQDRTKDYDTPRRKEVSSPDSATTQKGLIWGIRMEDIHM
ncbi:28462_t:CDS:1, partial [Dentiscutata erythropus]